MGNSITGEELKKGEKNNISNESDTEKGKKRNTEKENEGEGKLYQDWIKKRLIGFQFSILCLTFFLLSYNIIFLIS